MRNNTKPSKRSKSKRKMTRGNYNHPINPNQIHQNPRILPISTIHYPQHHYNQQPLVSDYEAHLRDEVLYLHSLWHRGPPSSQTPLFLRPSNSTQFKRIWRPPVSDKEWPVESKPTSPSPSESAWPEFKPVSKPVFRPATDEERGSVLSLKIHLKGLDLCSGLFGGGAKDGNDDDDDDDDEDDDDGFDDVEEYELLMKVFEETRELREFYVKNCGGGEFYCLICGVLRNKLRKTYNNCVALVQHCVTISNPKKKAAHRALGHVICKVLGWDVNRLPSVGDACAKSLGNSSEVEGVSKNNADGQATDENAGLKTDEVHQNLENVQLEKNIPCLDSGESLDCRSSLVGDAAKQSSECEPKESN